MLSGTNNASLASDVEMKIRFPSSHRTNSFNYHGNGESRDSRMNNGIYEDSRFSHSKQLNDFENENSYYNESELKFSF